MAEDIELRSGDQITGVRLILAYANSSIRGVVNLDGRPLPPGLTGVASLLQKGKVLFGIRGDLSNRGEFLLQNVTAGEYTLAVSARDANNRYWRSEQPITIAHDQVAEAIVVLKP